MAAAKLTDKVAVVTGAGNGIGRAIARAIASEGAAVLLADIALADAEAVGREIVDGGGRALAWHCDVGNGTAVRAMIEGAVANFGRLDVLVCNAATFSPITTVEHMAEADWSHALAINLTGAFLCCKFAIPALRAGGGGSIILMASQMARVANPGQAAYCATKGALVQLAKAMALDHVGDNIRVNTLSPGGIA
ncbi:MAG: SDR family NAD(P)-dependent oxidoreductase, partial [Alphaproteobacteria bacterium]